MSTRTLLPGPVQLWRARTELRVAPVAHLDLTGGVLLELDGVLGVRDAGVIRVSLRFGEREHFAGSLSLYGLRWTTGGPRGRRERATWSRPA